MYLHQNMGKYVKKRNRSFLGCYITCIFVIRIKKITLNTILDLHKNPRPIHNRWLVHCLGKKTLSSSPYEVIYSWNHPSICPMTPCNIDGFSFLDIVDGCHAIRIPKHYSLEHFRPTVVSLSGFLPLLSHTANYRFDSDMQRLFHIFHPLLHNNAKNSFLLRLNNFKERSESSTRCFCSPATTLSAYLGKSFLIHEYLCKKSYAILPLDVFMMSTMFWNFTLRLSHLCDPISFLIFRCSHFIRMPWLRSVSSVSVYTR